MDEVDVIIVGAGLAGLSAAWRLSDAGLQVLVVERGDAPGTKNVTGGRLYLEPIREACGDLIEGAPFERRVVRERITAVAGEASMSFSFEGGRFRGDVPHSVTVLRGRLDKWLGERVASRGVFIVPGYVVVDVLREGSRVVGVKTHAEELRAKVVIAADGVLSTVAVKAGLRPEWKPRDLAVGIKEVIALDRGKIEDRFQLRGDEGEARLFFGSLTEGLFGGGFLYTNLESISLGVVLGLHDLSLREAKSSPEILEAFKARPEIGPLVKGGELVEYSAHVVPEAGLKPGAKLHGDGILVTGDAAGLALNTGLTVRGMEFALLSGALAGEAVKRCAEMGDFSAFSLAVYGELLRDTALWKDLETFAGAPAALSHRPLIEDYPGWAVGLMERLFAVGPDPKEKASTELWRFAREHLLKFRILSDLKKLKKL